MDTPQFPHHRDCEALTGITLDHLPRDRSLGRVRRFAKGAYVWQPDDAADRIYFLRRGRVVVMTAKPHERPVALRTRCGSVAQEAHIGYTFCRDPAGRHTARLRSIAEHATSMSTKDSSTARAVSAAA